jgi:hypothetical protein
LQAAISALGLRGDLIGYSLQRRTPRYSSPFDVLQPMAELPPHSAQQAQNCRQVQQHAKPW